MTQKDYSTYCIDRKHQYDNTFKKFEDPMFIRISNKELNLKNI